MEVGATNVRVGSPGVGREAALPPPQDPSGLTERRAGCDRDSSASAGDQSKGAEQERRGKGN